MAGIRGLGGMQGGWHIPERLPGGLLFVRNDIIMTFSKWEFEARPVLPVVEAKAGAHA